MPAAGCGLGANATAGASAWRNGPPWVGCGRSVQQVVEAELLERLAQLVAQSGVDLHRAVAGLVVPPGELGVGVAHRWGYVAFAKSDDGAPSLVGQVGGSAFSRVLRDASTSRMMMHCGRISAVM